MSQPREPLPLFHSWPLADSDTHFNLGRELPAGAIDYSPAGLMPRSDRLPQGMWHCALENNQLHWSLEVNRMFGLPPGPAPARGSAVALYRDDSRIALERLRAHAIRHRRGFTIDAEVGTGGNWRWIRVIAMPIVEAGRVIALRGLKCDVDPLYRRNTRRP